MEVEIQDTYEEIMYKMNTTLLPFLMPLIEELPFITPLNEELPFITPLNEELPFITPLSEELPFITPLREKLPFITPLIEEPIDTLINEEQMIGSEPFHYEHFIKSENYLNRHSSDSSHNL